MIGDWWATELDQCDVRNNALIASVNRFSSSMALHSYHATGAGERRREVRGRHFRDLNP